MAELADALDSGSRVRKNVWVRVPLAAGFYLSRSNTALFLCPKVPLLIKE